MIDKKAFFLALLGFLLPTMVLAADFDPSYLISDSEMVNYNSMTQNDIQNFLNNRKGTLDNYLTFDKENNPKTAPQAFFEVAQRWLINPKYLLVLVQKEQSLLEDAAPSQKQYDWATGYGICDSCGMDDSNVQRFKGFYRQINSAAAQTRYYMDNINEFSFQPDKTYNIDGQSVKLKNTATAGLYNYTPHLHGNQNFWNLWNKYFARKWPDGTLLTSSDGDDVYYIENGLKRKIASKAVFASRFDAKKIITVSHADIDSYGDGASIKYVNFSLLQVDSGDIYMIINDVKRKIDSQAVFAKLGFKEDDITKVTADELTLYREGSNITEYTMYPTGVLVQYNKAKKTDQDIYYIIAGQKRPVPTKEILTANFSGMSIKKMTADELDMYPVGDNVPLPDGWLVRTKKDPAVFVVSGGKRMPFANRTAFASLNYSIKNVKIIADATMEAHQVGQSITGQW